MPKVVSWGEKTFCDQTFRSPRGKFGGAQKVALGFKKESYEGLAFGSKLVRKKGGGTRHSKRRKVKIPGSNH